MSTANLDSADLKAVGRGGMIREDVMDKIWDISHIPLPFTDRAGFGGSVDNEYTEWTVDRLRDPNLNNAVVDGADITQNDTNTGSRLGNHCQISVKEVQVSSRADASDTIGRDRELSYQVMMRQRELRRDVEAISLSMQGSVADDGATIAGKAGSVFSFIKTNVNLGATGTAAGFNPTTGLTASVVPGTKRGLTETMIKNMANAIHDKGGDPDVLMARPAVIRLISEYMFTASARIATMTTDIGQGRDGGAVAKGSVNVFQTDFGVTLDLVPNRLMPQTAAGTSSILFADWAYVEGAYLRGYQVEPLAKTGLSEKRMMSVDWTLKVLNEEALGAIHAVDESIAVVS